MGTDVEVHEDETPAPDTTVTIVETPDAPDDTATLVSIGTAVGRLETGMAALAGTVGGILERLDNVELTASSAQDTAIRAEGEAIDAQITAEDAAATAEAEAETETVPEEPPRMHWLDRKWFGGRS